MRVAVIGAGVAGLVAAYRLTQEGHDCDVYERWPGLGGQAATLDVGGGRLLERYYHHLYTSDTHMSALYDELEMPDEIEWRRSSVAIFTEGRSHPFTTPLDLLRFKPLTLRSRARMGLAVLWLQRRHRDGAAFDNQTAREWVERFMGREVYAKVWGPLLRAKFADRADEISMAFLWSKLTLRRQIQGDQAREELLGYPRGSFETVFVRLAELIVRAGGRVLIDRPAAAVAADADGSFVVTAGVPDSFRTGSDPRRFAVLPDPEHYDAVLATVPSDVFDRLLDPGLEVMIDPAYMARVRRSEYNTALCVLLELDRQLTSFYWTNICDDEVPFIGLVEQTNLVEPDRYDGRRFTYIANYVPAGDPLLELDTDQLLDAYEPGLRKVRPDFSRAWIKRTWRFTEPAAQPIATVGYPARMPALQTGVPGLVLANTTQIYPEDRGTNYSVRLGDQAAAAVLARRTERVSVAGG